MPLHYYALKLLFKAIYKSIEYVKIGIFFSNVPLVWHLALDNPKTPLHSLSTYDSHHAHVYPIAIKPVVVEIFVQDSTRV